MTTPVTSPEAYGLLHQGAVALAKVEANGICVDTAYLEGAQEVVERKMRWLRRRLFQSEEWRVWRQEYGEHAKLGSREQLGKVIFHTLKHACLEFTETGRPKTDEAALSKLNVPFVKYYCRLERLRKLRSTYLAALSREVIHGRLHPSFNLHTVQTFRSSSSDPNFQNIPIRNKEIGAIIRRCFIPSPGNVLVEIDYKGIEVRAAAWYHKDPTMLAYIADEKSCMHRDTAMQLFMLTKEQVDKRTTRDWAKNRFVFPEFYGSVFFQCAPHLWGAVMDESHKLPGTNVSVKQHLASKGIKELGDVDPQARPRPGTFVHHVKGVEESFWKERFPVYTAWKNGWYQEYVENGWFRMLSGFVCKGYYKRNQVINYPVQGVAFHCLLWSLVRLQRHFEKYKFRAKIVGQIHDSMLIDCPPSELQDVLDDARWVMTELCPKHWPWIITALDVEPEVTEPSSNWHEKKTVALVGDRWEIAT